MLPTLLHYITSSRKNFLTSLYFTPAGFPRVNRYSTNNSDIVPDDIIRRPTAKAIYGNIRDALNKAVPLDEKLQNNLFKQIDAGNLPPGFANQISTMIQMASGIDFASGLKALEIIERFIGNSRDAAIQTVRDKIAPSFYYRFLIINRPTLKKYDGNAFYHRQVTRDILDTDIDANSSAKRWKLTFKGGFNQKLVLIFNSPSFTTYADLMFFCQVPRAINQAKTEYDERENFENLAEFSDLKNPYPISDTRGKIRITSFIRAFHTELNISNDSKNYKTYVRVYVCQMKNMKNCNQRVNLTTSELIQEMNDELIDPLRRSLKQRQILHPLPVSKEEDSSDFAKEMYISTNATILDFQSVQENVNILSVLDYTLKPTDKGTVHITHNMTRGIDLVELSRYGENMECDPKTIENCPSTKACATTFFMMEIIGSYGAELVNKKDDEDRKTGTAPFQIRIREKISVTYKKNIKDPQRGGDVPYFDVNLDEDNEMITSPYEDQFQTKKGSDFNIDFKDIDIDGTKPKAKYNLSVDATSMVTNFGDIVRNTLGDNTIDDRKASNFQGDGTNPGGAVKLPKNFTSYKNETISETFDRLKAEGYGNIRLGDIDEEEE